MPPKRLKIVPKLKLEIVSSDGSSASQILDAADAHDLFSWYVRQILEVRTFIRQVNLYDNANRLYKTFKYCF